MLARLQIQARTNPDPNPLKVVQVLLGHASLTTTAIYLRCVELHERDLSESRPSLYGELIPSAAKRPRLPHAETPYRPAPPSLTARRTPNSRSTGQHSQTLPPTPLL